MMNDEQKRNLLSAIDSLEIVSIELRTCQKALINAKETPIIVDTYNTIDDICRLLMQTRLKLVIEAQNDKTN